MMYQEDFSVTTMRPTKGGGRRNKQERNTNQSKRSIYSSKHVRNQLSKSNSSKSNEKKTNHKKNKNKHKNHRK